MDLVAGQEMYLRIWEPKKKKKKKNILESILYK